jgi:hypothetical protein
VNWDAILQMLQERAVGRRSTNTGSPGSLHRWENSDQFSGEQCNAPSATETELSVLRFIGNTISVVLNITLVVAILVTSVSRQPLCRPSRSSGTGDRTAWAGLLANFAAV